MRSLPPWRPPGHGFPRCEAIGSNVSDPGIALSIASMLGAQRIPIRWIESRLVQCGVHNRYADPSQLGTDRWAALIGARSICAGACVVVGAGTAVTVDALTATGDFVGGLIIPGLSLMADALARDTARLPRDTGAYTEFRGQRRMLSPPVRSTPLPAPWNALSVGCARGKAAVWDSSRRAVQSLRSSRTSRQTLSW